MPPSGLALASVEAVTVLSDPVTCEDVPVLSASADASQDRNPEQMAEVHVDIRKFLQFLAGQHANPTKAVCGECACALLSAVRTLRSPVASRAAHALCCAASAFPGPWGVWVPRPALGARCAGGHRSCASPGAGQPGGRGEGGPGLGVERVCGGADRPPPQVS